MPACGKWLTEWMTGVNDLDCTSRFQQKGLNHPTRCRAKVRGGGRVNILVNWQLIKNKNNKSSSWAAPLPSDIIKEKKNTMSPWMRQRSLIRGDIAQCVWHLIAHDLRCPENFYSLVEPYLIDIFRQAVNLVGARHREIFSQDHKRLCSRNVSA